ncbi:unnamed protein product [Boreogadus saida]
MSMALKTGVPPHTHTHTHTHTQGRTLGVPPHTHTFFPTHDLHLDVVSGLSTKPGQTIVFQPHYVKQKQMSDCNKVLYLYCKYNGELEKSYMVELYLPNVTDRLLSDLAEFIGLAAFCSCCGNKK